MQLKKRSFFYRKRSSEKIFRSNVMKKDEEKMVTYFWEKKTFYSMIQKYKARICASIASEKLFENNS